MWFVKPAPGVIVRHPETMQPLPPEGADVEPASYWVRRERVGDVTVTRGDVPKPAATSSPRKGATS